MSSVNPQSTVSRTRPSWGAAAVIFVIVAVAGVFYAKWDPYFLKLGVVSVHHTLGPSIITGKSAAAPAPGLAAAWDYFLAYFKDIWVALVVGLVVGAGVQSLLPRSWLLRVLGQSGWGSSSVAVAASVPSMMCTCCSAPVAVGLSRQKVAPGAVFGYWLGNPVLNPATIVFMGFVLGWNWALLRIVIGLILVAGGVYIGNRWGEKAVPDAVQRDLDQLDAADPGPSVGRFFAALGRLAVGLLPEYVVIVALLGAVRAWLFPAMSPALGHSAWLVLVLAVVGTLFVIPTAGEIPIVQTLMSYGLGLAGAGALMITLPAISLPSMAMLSQAVPKAQLARLAAWVAVMGLVTALVAHFVL